MNKGMKSKMKVGQKGQVVIPKHVRQMAGIREGAEVTVQLKDGEVVIKRAGPPTESYVDYFITTFSKKLEHEVNVKSVIEGEEIERTKRVH